MFCLAGDVDNTILIAECIDMMFFKRRKQIPTSRLLAFIKRLSIVSLQLDPSSAAIILNLLRKLMNVILFIKVFVIMTVFFLTIILKKLNKNSDLLFDNEYQDCGIYNPELTQPDYANAQNTALWELHLLKVLKIKSNIFFHITNQI